MTPSTVPTPVTLQSRQSSMDTGCAVCRSGQRPKLRQHPPELSPADAISPPARSLERPNRVHLRLGPAFCLGILPTPPRGDAVSLSYPPLTCHRRTQTCTGWFHGFISVRSRGAPAPRSYNGGLSLESCASVATRDEGAPAPCARQMFAAYETKRRYSR